MSLSSVQSFFHNPTVQFLIVLVAATIAALAVYLIFSSMSFEQSTSRRLGKFAGTIPTGMTEEIGGAVLKLYGPGYQSYAGQPGLGSTRRKL